MAEKSFNDASSAPKNGTNSWMETAWEKFTPFELVMWTHLFTKSGTLRQQGDAPEKKDIEKAVKDLHMARHYLDMLKKKTDQLGLEKSSSPLPRILSGIMPGDDIGSMASAIASNFNIAETQPVGSTRHKSAGAQIYTLLSAIEERLEKAEQSSRPEVKAALDKQSHWKKKGNGGPAA